MTDAPKPLRWSIDDLGVLDRTSTPGPWYACTWDPMERPHVSLVEGPHHGSSDIAQNLTILDAALIAEARNALPNLLALASAASRLMAGPEPTRDDTDCLWCGAFLPNDLHDADCPWAQIKALLDSQA